MSGLLFDIETLEEDKIQKLKVFEQHLKKWNEQINLVSNSNSQIIWIRHILDSLQLIPLLTKVNKIADMGTGIGLPSLPLAIACPEIIFFAIEPNRKKNALLSELIRSLSIPNIHLLPEKVERVVVSHMDVVCCRAFGEFIRDANLAYKMLKPGGFFMTFKTALENRIPNGFKKVTNHRYQLPKYPREFNVVVSQKSGDID